MLAAPPVPAWPDKKHPLVYDPFAVTSGAVAATEFYLRTSVLTAVGTAALTVT